MQQIAALIAPETSRFGISAVILGGGYGRGEGGVTLDKDGNEGLHNDYDFFIITENISFLKKRRLKDWLADLSCQLTEEIGIDVDFSPPKNRRELSRMEHNMMWQELKHGHKVIWGDSRVLDLLPDYDIRLMPAIEGVRLMLNRGAGLIFCQDKLKNNEDTPESLEFIRRNIYKARNACGDVCLIAAGDYHWSYVERLKKLEHYRSKDKLIDSFYEKYRESVEYKLQPRESELNLLQLQALLDDVIRDFEKFNLRILWFWLKCPSDAPEAVYGELERSYGGPENVGLTGTLKNLVLNILEVGMYGLTSKYCLKHPRYRLFSSMPLILFAKTIKTVYTTAVLGVGVNSSENDQRTKFIKLWNRFN